MIAAWIDDVGDDSAGEQITRYVVSAYPGGVSSEDLAQLIGCTRLRVDQIERAAIEKILRRWPYRPVAASCRDICARLSRQDAAQAAAQLAAGLELGWLARSHGVDERTLRRAIRALERDVDEACRG